MHQIFFNIKRKFYYKFLKRKFSSFKKAKIFCDIICKNSYENDYLSNYRLDKFQASIKNIDHNKPKAFDFLNKTIQIFFSKYRNYPKILEIGGGFGENSYAIKKLLKKNLPYSVLESNKIIKLANKIENKINYFYDLDLALSETKPDLIFSSSTLQYMSNPYKILSILNDYKPKMISLTRNSFSKKTSYYSQPTELKSNGYGEHIGNYENRLLMYPHTTINFEKLNCILKNYKTFLVENDNDYKISDNSFSKNLIYYLNY